MDFWNCLSDFLNRSLKSVRPSPSTPGSFGILSQSSKSIKVCLEICWTLMINSNCRNRTKSTKCQVDQNQANKRETLKIWNPNWNPTIILNNGKDKQRFRRKLDQSEKPIGNPMNCIFFGVFGPVGFVVASFKISKFENIAGVRWSFFPIRKVRSELPIVINSLTLMYSNHLHPIILYCFEKHTGICFSNNHIIISTYSSNIIK